MLNHNPSTYKVIAFFIVILSLCGLVVFLFSHQTAFASEIRQETEAYCLSCHGNSDLSISLPDGESISLYISSEMLSHSIHSQSGIECEACHTNIKTYPHPENEYQSSRELSRAYYLSCKKCHSVNYEKTQDR